MTANENPKIKLYWLEQSRAQSILWLLEELKLDYELELIHRNKDTKLAPPEMKRIHALGKSPVITITPAGSDTPITLAETGFIAQYLSEHFGQNTTLVPKRYKDGQEGKAGGETEEWMRWLYFLHYAEGSFAPVLVKAMLFGVLKSARIPFFIRPITSMVANQVFVAFISPNIRTHLEFIENQLATSGGDYLCGKNLTAADMIITFGLMTYEEKFEEYAKLDSALEIQFPRISKYIARMYEEPGYKKSTEKIATLDSTYKIKFNVD
ncbi:hypothetical protein BX600DRAFT_510418 [Xylariales sp. PMI_506]|nr:hypothetical protein BX600DRAFT_510418 [Xylariales sp. PMI_506]